MSIKQLKQKLAHYVLHRLTLQMALLLVVLGGLTAAIYYGLQVNQNVASIYGQANQVAAGTPFVFKPTAMPLAAGAVRITNVNGWQSVAQMSGSAHCTASVSPDTFSACVDSVTLIPLHETFTNNDQFTVTVSVYKHSTSTYLYRLVINADDSNGGLAMQNVVTTKLAGKSGQIVRREANTINDPGGVETERETDLQYGMISSRYDILITSEPFVGQHYSYSNQAKIDYRTYILRIDLLVKSIVVK